GVVDVVVSFRWAAWTPRSPMPLTAQRRNVCFTGAAAADSDVVVPNFDVAAPASTYVSAVAAKVSVAAFTATVTVVGPLAPSRSGAVAVSVCVPIDRLGWTSAAPVPRLPSRLDVQRMLALTSPSSE